MKTKHLTILIGLLAPLAANGQDTLRLVNGKLQTNPPSVWIYGMPLSPYTLEITPPASPPHKCRCQCVEEKPTYTVTNGFALATNLFYVATNINWSITTNAIRIPNPGDIYRADSSGELIYTPFSGVTNLVQLCGKIGHVWKSGMPPTYQANNEELWRYCILCEKQQYHQGEWK